MTAKRSQNYWNPFRDWNVGVFTTADFKGGLKTTETLLGIETKDVNHICNYIRESQNYWNPFRDWNLQLLAHCLRHRCLKTTETLLGIETQIRFHPWEYVAQSQNYWNPFRDWNGKGADWRNSKLGSQNYWNPFRDWNNGIESVPIAINGLKTTETLLGIETQSA